MKLKSCLILIVVLLQINTFGKPNPITIKNTRLSFPYKSAGLTKRQAAVHLLNRFTYGIRPGDIDAVLDMGLEYWFKQQLNQEQSESELSTHLSDFDALKMDNETIVNSFLPQFEIRKIIKSEGIFIADSNFEKKEYKAFIDSIMKQKKIRYPAEYQRQLINQKILRAIYSNNQLAEVLTDFWFNHFNVSLSKNQCAMHILSFERDVIRPRVLGSFENLLVATAKSPAMLEYLDNNYSVSFNNELSRKELNNRLRKSATTAQASFQDSGVIKLIKQRKEQGLNENYARELMELHTLGVDGGYKQKDVTEVAKIFTGWSVAPLLKYNDNRKNFENSRKYNNEKLGFVFDGDFFFKANRHDDSAKTVLNYQFAPNGGYEEGLTLLHDLANDPATANFICKKIAVRFVSDTPPEELIQIMAKAFLKTKGDLKAVLSVMVNSTYFWDENSVRKKIKTPFELSISAIRATNATVKQPYQIFNWCNTMGQKFYYYQAPTGFPDKSAYWVNTSSLLNRMNFGVAFSSNKIPGITMDSTVIFNKYEPESLDAAIVGISNTILPETSTPTNISRVLKLVSGKELNDKLTQVVGLLIGSPEFQKR